MFGGPFGPACSNSLVRRIIRWLIGPKNNSIRPPHRSHTLSRLTFSLLPEFLATAMADAFRPGSQCTLQPPSDSGHQSFVMSSFPVIEDHSNFTEAGRFSRSLLQLFPTDHSQTLPVGLLQPFQVEPNFSDYTQDVLPAPSLTIDWVNSLPPDTIFGMKDHTSGFHPCTDPPLSGTSMRGQVP